MRCSANAGPTNLYLASRGERGGAERLAQVAASQRSRPRCWPAELSLDTEAEQSGYRTRLFGCIAYALQGSPPAAAA